MLFDGLTVIRYKMTCLSCSSGKKVIKLHKYQTTFDPYRPIFIIPESSEYVIPYMFKCLEGWGTRECFYICWYDPKSERNHSGKILHISRLVYVYDPRDVTVPELIITYDYSGEQNLLEADPKRHTIHMWWNDIVKNQGRPILYVNTTNFGISNRDANVGVSKICHSDYGIVNVSRNKIKKVEADSELYKILT